MKVRTIPHTLVVALLGVIVTLASPITSRAEFIVNSGFDLLHSEPGTSFGGVPFVGVPLGTFDFGSGPLGTGNADTIVYRIVPASPGAAPITRAELVALQLMSADPVNFGLGLGTYFVTLQSTRGGPLSSGFVSINFGSEGVPHGTFDSFFDVFFDLRFGSLTGPIALSGNALLTVVDVPWSHFPPPNAVEIVGVNTFLNGSNRLTDFFPDPFTEQHPGPPATIHSVSTASVPAPSTLALASIGILSLVGFARRSRNRVSPEFLS